MTQSDRQKQKPKSNSLKAHSFIAFVFASFVFAAAALNGFELELKLELQPEPKPGRATALQGFPSSSAQCRGMLLFILICAPK